MIVTFANKDTEQIHQGNRIKGLPADVQKIALRKMIMMDNAESIQDLKVPPGNRLERLKGSRKGKWSIRINDKYRIIFSAKGNKFYQVEIIDYHRG